MKKNYKERRLYYGICARGGHKFVSFHRKRIKGELCRKHRINGVSKDQMILLGPGEIVV